MTNRTSHARSGVLSALRRIVSGGSRRIARSRPPRQSRVLLALQAAVVTAVLAGVSFAQTSQTWRSEASSGSWQGSTNWWNFPNGSPIVFGQQQWDNNHFLTQTNQNGGSTLSTHRWLFQSGASSAHTFSGDAVRFFDFSGSDPQIVNQSSATHIINNNIEGDGDGGDPLNIRTESSGGLTFGGTVNNQGSPINVQSSGGSPGTVTFNGVMSGSGALNSSHSGTVVLAGANTYSGATDISNGVALVANNAALGSTNTGTTIRSGASLQMSNGIAIGGEALTLSGTGVSSGGALRSVSGSNSYTGPITANSALTSFGAATNSTLVISNVNSGAQEFWVVGDGTTIVAGGATNSGSGTAFVKTNTGTAVLAASNAWSGNEFIREGTVVLSNNNALGTAGTTFLGATEGTTAATLRIGQGIANSNSITVEGGGTGTRTLAYAEGSGTGTQVGSLTLNTNSLAFNVASGGTIQFTGTVSTLGTTRLSVDGGGTVISTGNSSTANSDNYQVRVGNGTLIIGGGTLIGRTNVAGLGHAIDLGVDLNNNIVNAASRLYASNGVTISNSIYVSTTNGQARVIGQRDMASSSTATYTGPVGLSSAALTIEAGTNSTVTLSGAVTNFAGTGNAVVKTGAGTVVLSGNNTHSGGTFLDSGALRLNNVNAGGTGSIVQSNGTSTLQIAAGGTITNNMSVYNVEFVNNGNTLSGRITNNNATYDVAAGTTNTLSGFVTGSGGLTKTGEGVLSVTGTTNDYAGATTISNGTLRVTTLADAGTVSSIGTNATVNFSGTNASTTVLDYTGGNVTTDRSLVFNGVATNGEGGTLRVSNSSTVVTLDGSASGTGRMVVAGGTVVLSNTTTSNSFAPASIQVSSNSTLQIAANEQIGNTTDLILNGGTLITGTSSAGYAETLGTLTLSSNSTIDLGSLTGGAGTRNLTFGNSSAITWAGTLTVTNWQGVADSSGTAGRIFFGVGGLTSTQLAQVQFSGYGTGAKLLGSGELVPIPEPRVYAAAIALLAAIGWRERRRILSLVKPKAQPGA